MSILRVALIGNPTFYDRVKICSRVFIRSEECKTLVKDMFATMRDYNALGLAAPQIRVNRKIFVAGCEKAKGFYPPRAFFNPKIMESSKDSFVHWESCLSVPGYNFLVQRPQKTVIAYVDENGDKWKATATGYASAIIHHEMEHLNNRNLFHSKIQDIAADEELDNTEEVEEVDPGSMEYEKL
eukprot:TRINITY_DN17307_c0_g1_i1.p1 TRINITY_DN17307_c0_g1~~TRINITY_DN17307_c0_g1_i1.p1  ORF type:complete len:183 (+),score=43.99 TRINITY_DN17307_c0_g1_i1:53-601(+)